VCRHGRPSRACPVRLPTRVRTIRQRALDCVTLLALTQRMTVLTVLEWVPWCRINHLPHATSREALIGAVPADMQKNRLGLHRAVFRDGKPG
jgi:hypothetical protein